MVSVSVWNAHPRRRVRRSDVVRTVRRVLRGEGRSDAALSVVFVDGRYAARINRKYLGHRGSTDVISFPLGEGLAIEGELYVNLDRARVQARRFGVTYSNEVSRLVVHGTLHLLGYDDRRGTLRRRMHQREELYL